jgi:hypothetical protein
MSSSTIDLFLTYHFLKRLSTPFEEWDAYKLKIIDAEGNVLRKAKTLTKPEEISAWGYFDRLVANLKKLLAKVPGGKTKIASYAAALLLIKEHKNPRDIDDDELQVLVEDLFNMEYSRFIAEEGEGITNNVGSGRVAGLGVGAQGEPPKTKKVKINTMFKRKMIDVDPKIPS